MDEAREDRDVPAMGVFMRKSTFRFVLESTARRALRFEEEVAGWLAVTGCCVGGGMGRGRICHGGGRIRGSRRRP